MHSQYDGIMENVCKIGDIVEKGDLLCYINNYEKNMKLEQQYLESLEVY